MSLIYKTLFEVKLLHEFYLTNSDGQTIFSFPSQKDRINFLLKQFTEDKQSINDDLQFEYPKELGIEYSNYNLKLLTTYSGCKVAIRVNQKILADGSLVYTPFVSLPDNFGIYILFSKKNNSVEDFTNKRINSPVPSKYFFSNDELTQPKDFPFLTNPVSPVRMGYNYEQGELVSFGPGDIRSYYQNSSGEQWNPFGGTKFANENDRLLLPLKFYYSFTGSNVTSASFTLKNKSGNTIKVIEVRNVDKMNKTFIDFSGVADILKASLSDTFSDFIFTLEVSGNNGYHVIHPVFFGDGFYSNGTWGMVAIHPKTSDTAFDLIDADGFLIKRKNAAGDWTDAPLFEIPVRSRFAYLRFTNNQKQELQLISDMEDYLEKEGKTLTSKIPKAVTQSFFQIQQEGGVDFKYVPNPLSYELLKDDTNGLEKLYFNVMVPKSTLFPVV